MNNVLNNAVLRLRCPVERIDKEDGRLTKEVKSKVLSSEKIIHEAKKYGLNTKEKKLVSPVIRIRDDNSKKDNVFDPRELDLGDNKVLKCPVKRIIEAKGESNEDGMLGNAYQNYKNYDALNNAGYVSRYERSRKVDPIYNKTIFYDQTAPLLREDYRNRKSIQVSNIINSKTIQIKTNNGFINDFLFEECHKWFGVRNSFVFIESGTGTGKTTFIENLVMQFNLKALILTNRTIAKEQMKNRLGIVDINDNISVMSYQSFEKCEEVDPLFLDASYQVLVLDEIHHLIDGALLDNSRIMMGYKKILSTQKIMKIAISATISDIREKIIGDLLLDNDDYIITNERIFNYYNDKNASVIRSIECIYDFNHLVSTVLNSKDKWIVFIDKISNGEKLRKLMIDAGIKSNDCVFLNRQSVSGNADSTEEDKRERKKLVLKTYQEIINNQSFSCKVLITTKIMDNAINIVDDMVKNICIYEDDKVTFLQMLGRKRCNGTGDFINLYIPAGDRASIVKRRNNFLGKEKQMRKIAYMLDQGHKKTFPEIIEEGIDKDSFRKSLTCNTYRDKYEFNTLGYIKVLTTIRDLEELLSNDIFSIKKSWVLKHINCNPMITFESNSERYIKSINEYIDKKILKSDISAKISINKAFKKIFGVVGKNDDNDSISLSRLKTKFKIKNIPLEIEETRSYFILRRTG